MMGRVVSVPGTVRAIDKGNGICELQKDIDVLCIVPERQKRKAKKLLFMLGTAGLFAGLAATLIYLAPALGTIVFAVVAWCGFAGMATGE